MDVQATMMIKYSLSDSVNHFDYFYRHANREEWDGYDKAELRSAVEEAKCTLDSLMKEVIDNE